MPRLRLHVGPLPLSVHCCTGELNVYGLTEQQRLGAIATCERIEDANDKIQKAFRNILRILDNAAKGRPATEGLEP